MSYLGKIGVCPEKFFDSQNGTLTEIFLATGGGEVAEVEQRGAKSGRLTEGPQRLRCATVQGRIITVFYLSIFEIFGTLLYLY